MDGCSGAKTITSVDRLRLPNRRGEYSIIEIEGGELFRPYAVHGERPMVEFIGQ